MDDDDDYDGSAQLKRERAAKQRLAKAGRAAETAISAHNARHENRLAAINACLAAADAACRSAGHSRTLHVQTTAMGEPFFLQCGDGNLSGELRFSPVRTTGMVHAIAQLTVDGDQREQESIATVDPLDYDAATWMNVIADFFEKVANASPT